MTFQNVQVSRVVRSVAIIVGISLVLSFLTSCVMLPLMSSDMFNRFSDLADMFSKSGTTAQEMNDQLNSIVSDYAPQLNIHYAIQWALAAAVTFIFARRTASTADTPEQAVGYGVAIGLGTLVSYGLFCVLFSIAYLIVRLVFFGAIIGAGILGGRVAAEHLEPGKIKRSGEGFGPLPGAASFGQPSAWQPARPTGNPDIFYNMGVQAALGGRREEAREHFKQVLQFNPRHVPAWLQLANLADTPEDAWNYIQQARLISPNDPAVQQAAELIWPKVSASAQSRGPAHNQPPYPGGASDDVAIPRTRLPGSEAPTLTEMTPPDLSQAPDASQAADASGPAQEDQDDERPADPGQEPPAQP